jgi:hypothetical protein
VSVGNDEMLLIYKLTNTLAKLSLSITGYIGVIGFKLTEPEYEIIGT